MEGVRPALYRGDFKGFHQDLRDSFDITDKPVKRRFWKRKQEKQENIPIVLLDGHWS